VDGVTDVNVIAEHFASHFSNVCTSSSSEGTKRLRDVYEQMRSDYCGSVDDGRYRLL